MAGGVLAGWRDLFGRQESSHLPGGQKLCVCLNVWPLPSLWTSGASDTGSRAEAKWGWALQPWGTPERGWWQPSAEGAVGSQALGLGSRALLEEAAKGR